MTSLPVLLYHHVGPVVPGTYPTLTVSPERFQRHVRWLARCGFTGIRGVDWLAYRAGQALPAKSIVLTFDDAYADLVKHALPVLRAHNFGATVFVVTGHVGGENVWDQADGSSQHRLMTADQIRTWKGRGIEFGAHSRNHPDLTTLSDMQMDAEIRGSRDELTAIVGGPIPSFAYPYGRFNDVVLQRVHQAFDVAFSCDEGLNTFSTDVHCLRRTMVQRDDSVLALTCRARLGRYPVERWRARLAIRSRIRHAVGRLDRSDP